MEQSSYGFFSGLNIHFLVFSVGFESYGIVKLHENGRECKVCYIKNFFPDQNFQFSIFNFQLKHRLKSSNTNTCPDCFPKGRG